MSTHGDSVGQEWADRHPRAWKFRTEFLSNNADPDIAAWLLVQLVTMHPSDTAMELAWLDHTRGEHRLLGCPEQCPKF